MKIKILIVVIVLCSAGCKTTQHLQPADADLVAAQQRIPGITMNDLQHGYKIYVTNCSACHRLHDPKEFTADKWKIILLEMFLKAKMTDDTQKQLVTNFLVSKGK
jgi:hypothetical protein